MKIFQKFMFILIIVFWVAYLLDFPSININWGAEDYARITALDYKAVVVDEEESQAKVIITERLTFDIHAADADNTFWELWRDLPEEYVDGVKVDYNVLSVKQILDDGSEVPYLESSKLYWWDSDYTDSSGVYGPGKWYHSEGPYDGEYNFECLLFYVDGLYREEVVFEIQYEMNNASLRYNDSSELYLSLYYGESIEYLESVHGQILFPTDLMPKQGDFDAYTYGTTAHEFDFIESDSLNPGYYTFSFTLDSTQLDFKSYNQYIEFALIAHGEDKHKFTTYAPYNTYYHQDMLSQINKAQSEYEALPNKYLNYKKTILGLSIIGSVGILAFALYINKRTKKKYTFYTPSLKIEYFRDIPSDLDANFARKLVFVYHNKKDDLGDGYSAAMLSLVYKEYITLVQIDTNKAWDTKNIKIVINPEQELPRKTLSAVEDRYFTLINRHASSKEVTLTEFQKKIQRDYEYTTTFVNGVKTAINRLGVTEGYFQQINYKAPQTSMRSWAAVYVIIGLLVMFIGNLIIFNSRLDLAFGSFFILGFSFLLGALYFVVVSRNYILLTQLGQDEYVKWHGLYKFLNSQTLMSERNVLELVIWEKYLIYATAFGISDKVIKALKIRCPEEVFRTSPILHSPIYRSSVFYRSSRSSFRSSARQASYTSRSGGHGGYGGGGRGGGGGGGGH